MQDSIDSLSRSAILHSGGFRWISAFHVTDEFADRFLEVTAAVYGKALECYIRIGCDRWIRQEWIALAANMFRDWEEKKRAAIGETPTDFESDPICYLHPDPDLTKRSYPRWRKSGYSQFYYIHSGLWIYEVHKGGLTFSASGPSSKKLGHFPTALDAQRACEDDFAQHGYKNYRLGVPIDRSALRALPEKNSARSDDGIPKVAELLAHGGTCPICRYVYRKRRDLYYGSNNGTAHRAFHRQHVPVPEPRLDGYPPGDIRVDRKSPPWLHQMVYQRARYLQQQEHYDFVQWNEVRGIADSEYTKNVHALLLVEEPQLVVGTASFSWILWKDHAPGWRLNFIWIAGTWRRKGVLSKRWPAWRTTYGAFSVEPPWSKYMRAFLCKMGAPSPIQAEWIKNHSEVSV